MNHADVKKHLADYLEGDLALEDRALVDAHLDSCDPCSMEVEEMLQTIGLLRTLPEPEVPPMIAANVMRRIRAGESQPGVFERVRRAVGSVLEPTFVLPASAIAVAALVVTVTQGTFTQGPLALGPQATRPSSTSSVGVNAAGQHERDRNRVSTRGNPSMASALPSLTSGSSSGSGVHDRGSDAAASDSMRGSPRTIRLRVDGSGVARLSMSPRPASRRADGPVSLANGPVFTSAVPEAWAAEFSRVMYGDPAFLASGSLVAAEHSARASNGLIQPVARSRAVSQDRILDDLESDGADPRDAWLALGFEDPAEFARYIASQNLAEQELWAARLSERAEARGLLVEFIQALQDSGDATAIWVAGDFAAQAMEPSDRESSAASEAVPLR